MQQQSSQSISPAQFKRELRAFRADKLLTSLTSTDQNVAKALKENMFGCICLEAGKLTQAESHLQIASSMFQEFLKEIPVTNTAMNLGNLHSQKKEFDKALELYQAVVNDSPYAYEYAIDQRSMAWSSRLNSYSAYVDAHTNLACLLANLDRLTESYDYCIKAINMNPLNFQAQTNFGDLLRQLGRREEAINHTWEQIVKFTNILDESYTRPNSIQCKSLQSKNQESLNILCVKWGKKYGPEYVNKLFRGVRKHTTLELNFYCLTEDATGLDEQVKIIQLEGGWTGWWGKATLFSLQLEGRMFYIDLDMIITGSIDEILSYRGVFGILRTDEIACEKTNKNGYNSSIMAWSNNEDFIPVYQELQRNAQNIHKFIVRFDFWLEMMIHEADFLQELYPTQISDYVQECTVELPANTRIVSFPRTPKPHDAQASWIPDHW